jgi:hypothetical protein
LSLTKIAAGAIEATWAAGALPDLTGPQVDVNVITAVVPADGLILPTCACAVVTIKIWRSIKILIMKTDF